QCCSSHRSRIYQSAGSTTKRQSSIRKVLDANPQVVIEDHVNEKATAVVVGPGLGGTVRGNDIAATARQTAIQRNLPLLVDEIGLEFLDKRDFSRPNQSLGMPPHTGESQQSTQRSAPNV